MRSLLERQASFAAGLNSAKLPQGLTARIPQEAERRFGVYRNNVVVGLIEALRTRFPATERLVGEAFFRAAARLFIAGSPPRSPMLMFYGDAFPDFLESFEPARSVPYLPDVARLEAACTHAYHAADAEPVGASELAEAAAGGEEDLRFVLHPSLRLVASEYPIVAIWSCNRPGREPGPIDDWRSETALISRPASDVIIDAVSRSEAAFVASLAEGETFLRAVEIAVSTSADFEPARALARIVGGGLLVGIVRGGEYDDGV